MCVCVCVCVCVREKRKIEPTVWGKKVPFALDGIRTCTSGIRAHRASDYTTRTRARPPRVSRNKHFSHSPVSSTAKQSCMKTLQLLSAGPRRQASARTSAESDKACQRKTKDRADGMREKSAFCPRRDSNLYLWDTCVWGCFPGETATASTKCSVSPSIFCVWPCRSSAWQAQREGSWHGECPRCGWTASLPGRSSLHDRSDPCLRLDAIRAKSGHLWDLSTGRYVFCWEWIPKPSLPVRRNGGHLFGPLFFYSSSTEKCVVCFDLWSSCSVKQSLFLFGHGRNDLCTVIDMPP